ncbi:MAG: alanine--tRNA ligase [Anaerolineae bacterium]
MDAHELRQRYLDFFQSRGHAIIGGASLIPEHDPSVLFTTAGMHPLVPFLMGEPHPAGKRLANVQKCLRTDDIAEVGDDVHLTFFEMLGNWSLGDYWKRQAIEMSYAFLTEELGLEPDRLRITCFAGDEDAPRDSEAADIWTSLGIPDRHIAFLPKKDNWWGPAGATGPCGPDTEMFYDVHPGGPDDETVVDHPERFWEVWNDVFMQYDKRADGTFGPLAQRNVDTGMGLERTLALLEGVPSLYQTELFAPIVEQIRSLARAPEPFAVRVIADHVRAATFVLAEGIVPGNLDQPYIARRLIRRAVRYGRRIGIRGHFLGGLAEVVIGTLGDVYPEIEGNEGQICAALDDEETRFQRTLRRGEREFHKAVEELQAQGKAEMPGPVVFHLYDTYGFPPELTEELAHQEGLSADMEGYRLAFREHQERSRQSVTSRFRGGLAEQSAETVKLHTATHLLQEALRRVLGPHVEQRGSNITPERLRFDFTHPQRLSDGELAAVERIVNDQIERDLDVSWEEMSVDEALAEGAIGLFGERYGERVKVYSIDGFSKEICGGPHVEHTGELGHFRIVKQESVGAGVRRIRAVLEDEPPQQ